MSWELGRKERGAASDLGLDGEAPARRSADWQPAPGKVTRTMRLAHQLGQARLRRKAHGALTGAGPLDLVRGGGRRLPAHLEPALAAALGRDLSAVRIHDDAAAADAAERVNARAFAIGTDLYFASGQYDPGSPSGLHLLAHEIAHTAQAPGRAGEMSEPHDADEREADAFADRFVATPPTPQPSRLYGPHDLPMLSTVATVGHRVRRAPGSSAGTVSYPADPIELFAKRTTPRKKFDLVKPTYVPLIAGMVIVDGLPVTYRAGATAEVSAGASAWAGPANLNAVVVTMSNAQAAARKAAGVFGPIGEVAYDMANAPYKASANLHFDAGVEASLTAEAGFEAEVAAADMLAVGGYAKLKGTASGSSRVHLHGLTSFDYWVGGKASLNTSMTASWDTKITFSLAAEAGIFVELRPPKIPLLSDLYTAVRKLPGLDYVMPEYAALKSRREWPVKYPIYDKTKQWSLSREIQVFGGLDSKNVTGDPEETGLLAMAQSALTDTTHQKPEQEIPKEDKDPRPKPDVAGQRAAAQAQITSTKRTVAREQKWNKELLDAVKARKAAQVKQASAGGSAAPPLALPVATEDPEVQLGKRDTALKDADGAMGELTSTIGKLEPEEKNDNTEHRRAAGLGYVAIAKSADKVGDAIDADQGEFAKPLVSDDKVAEKEFNTLLAATMTRLDPMYDATTGEAEWCKEMLEATSGIAAVSSFREKVLERHNTARRANFDLERLGPSVEAARKRGLRGDYPGALADLKGLEPTIASTEGKLEALKTGRPTIPWDEDYVVPEDGQLMLLHGYRKGATVREKFYGDYFDRDKKVHHGYDDTTKTDMAAQLRIIRDDDGHEYWFYPDAPSGNASKKFPANALRPGETGDMYWLVYDSKQMPTRGHNHPPVAQHWNATGNATNQTARTEFFNGRGAGTQPLKWEPKTINSGKGSKDSTGKNVNYGFNVRVTFRGT